RKGLDRWNRILADTDYELTLPHVGFHRAVGTFANHHVSPDGQLLTDEQWTAEADSWLPTDEDRAYVESLMIGVDQPGRMAGWVAPPAQGIHQQPVDYEYVRLS
ncbi:MAG: benzoyl-CoA 2,3-epoxidase subunit BoxB, partial [Actinomycetota bacterium]